MVMLFLSQSASSLLNAWRVHKGAHRCSLGDALYLRPFSSSGAQPKEGVGTPNSESKWKSA